MAKKSGLTKVAVKIGTAVGKADKAAHKFAKAGALAKSELDDISKQVDALKKAGVFGEVKVYDTIPDILRDVNTGRLKAGFADYPILAYNLKQGGFPEVRLVESFKPTIVGTVAIGVRKTDQDLLKKINSSLAKLRANGVVDRILDKWGLKA